MSDAKAAASRKNGARSLGPSTPEGRERSSLNALKLGIFSQRRFLPEENPEDFYQLVDQLAAEFQAEGVLEMAYIFDMADRLCLKRRLNRAEVAAIELYRTAYSFGAKERKWSELSPTFFLAANKLQPQEVEAIQGYLDEVVTAARSIPPEDERFNRMAVSLDRALERSLRGLKEAQADRRARQQSVIVAPDTRHSAARETIRKRSDEASVVTGEMAVEDPV